MPSPLLQCICLLLAQSGHANHSQRCLLSGVKRTSRGHALTSAFDPKWTSSNLTWQLPASWLDPLRCWGQRQREEINGQNESKCSRHCRFEQEGGFLSQAALCGVHDTDEGDGAHHGRKAM